MNVTNVTDYDDSYIYNIKVVSALSKIEIRKLSSVICHLSWTGCLFPEFSRHVDGR